MDLSSVYSLIVIFPNCMYIYHCLKWTSVNNMKFTQFLFININLFFPMKSDNQCPSTRFF